MDKADHRLKLTNMNFRFEETPPLLLEIEAMLALQHGAIRKGLDLLERIKIQDLDFREKSRVLSCLALYRSNLGLLQESYDILLQLNTLVNKAEPFNIDNLEFQKQLKSSLGDASAIVLLDTIRSYQRGLDSLKKKNHLEIFNYTRKLLENNKQVLSLYPFVQSDWEYPVAHFGICITTSPMNPEALIKLERLAIEEIEKKYPDDFVIITTRPEEELVSA